MKRIIASLAIIAAAGGVATGGTFALFSDTEVSTGNTFTAGTLDLVLNNENPASTPLINITSGAGFAPGQTGAVAIALHNSGSVTGSVLSFQITGLSNEENGIIEPEAEAGDVTNGSGQGELQDQLSVSVYEGVTQVSAPSALAGVGVVPITGGLNPGQTRNLEFMYMYEDVTTNNLTMSDSVNFSLQFNLGQ